MFDNKYIYAVFFNLFFIIYIKKYSFKNLNLFIFFYLLIFN